MASLFVKSSAAATMKTSTLKRSFSLIGNVRGHVKSNAPFSQQLAGVLLNNTSNPRRYKSTTTPYVHLRKNQRILFLDRNVPLTSKSSSCIQSSKTGLSRMIDIALQESSTIHQSSGRNTRVPGDGFDTLRVSSIAVHSDVCCFQILLQLHPWLLDSLTTMSLWQPILTP